MFSTTIFQTSRLLPFRIALSLQTAIPTTAAGDPGAAIPNNGNVLHGTSLVLLKHALKALLDTSPR
jgi:hypothetical protein